MTTFDEVATDLAEIPANVTATALWPALADVASRTSAWHVMVALIAFGQTPPATGWARISLDDLADKTGLAPDVVADVLGELGRIGFVLVRGDGAFRDVTLPSLVTAARCLGHRPPARPRTRRYTPAVISAAAH